MLRLSVKSATCILILGMLALPLYSAVKKNVETAQKEEATPKQVEEINRFTAENSKLHKKLLYACVHNMQELSLALLIYASDNKGHFPPYLKVLEPSLQHKYRSPFYLFCCPLTDTRLQTWDEVDTKGDYLYLPERIMKPGPTQKPEDVLLIEREFNHRGDSQIWKNCLFIDGHIEAHSESSEIVKKYEELK